MTITQSILRNRTGAVIPEYHRLRKMLEQEIAESIRVDGPAALCESLALATAGGKRIRPLLTMISCAAVGGNPESALNAATAVELLHASSLVHDDIMDKSAIRRSRPTIHAVFGNKTAILAGDTLVALAYRVAARTEASHLRPVLDTLTEGFLSTCEGQAVDIQNTSSPESREHALMVEKKTARLIGAAAALGGILGDAKQVQIKALREFGISIGMAYQAQDDLLDVVGSVKQTGKSVQVDQKNGRQTFASDFDAHRRVSSTVERYTDQAYHFLEMLPESEHRENLKLLAESLVGRKK